MPEDFRGPFLKIHRAKTHIAELNAVLQRFMKRQSYKAVADFHSEPGWIIWVVRGKEVMRYDEFSPFIGDVVHNLRDALDLAVSVLMRNTGQSDEHVQFPSGDSLDAFHAAAVGGRKKPGLPPKLVTVLETRIQPYKGGKGHWLRTLHELAIMDKHRLIVPTAFGVETMHMQVEGKGDVPIRFVVDPVTIKDGTKLARISSSQWPEIKVNQETALTFAIQFDKRAPRELYRWDIVSACIHLANVAEEALHALETCL